MKEERREDVVRIGGGQPKPEPERHGFDFTRSLPAPMRGPVREPGPARTTR
jgi:hypothetical protein